MKLMKIKEFAEVVSGSTPKTNIDEYWNGEYIWITPAEIDNSSKYIYDSERKITEAGVKSCSLKLLKKNTVILTSRAPIGKVALAGNDLYCNQGFKNLVCDESIIYPKYIYYWLISKKEYLNSLGRGATFKEISKKIVEEIQVPVLSIDDQKRMAQILDKSQDLIDKRKEQIELLDELVKSRFIEMFGDPVTNPKGWEVRKLNELCDNLDKMRVPITSNSRVRGNVPYYGASGIVDYVEDYIFDETLLLVSEDGANLLARVTPIAFEISGKTWVNNHAHVLRFENYALQKYIEYAINLQDVAQYITGSTQPKLNQTA